MSEEVAGQLQKKIANSILFTDIQTLEDRHSGKYISNIMFDTHHVQNFVSTGVLNIMKDSLCLVTGGFDPIHRGHVEYIKSAKEI